MSTLKMDLKYTSGDIEGLKPLLKDLTGDAEWKVLNAYTTRIQFNNVTVTFHSTTGTIQVQAKKEIEENYKKIIFDILNGKRFATADLPEEVPISVITAVASNNISDQFKDSEIIIGLVGAVGVDFDTITKLLKIHFENSYLYEFEEVRISKDIIENLHIYKPQSTQNVGEYHRIMHFMEYGNKARKELNDNAILALGVTSIIKSKREKDMHRRVYVINSIKHPDEVKLLREVYGPGFYLIGIFSDINERTKNLISEKAMTASEAADLIIKDQDDIAGGHGQHTSDTYHLSDFFVHLDDSKKLKASIIRFLEIIFGNPTVTPLFEEYAMFMAFTASLRSADLSRQVGAVLAKDEDIIATGANDIPKYGGGLYWTTYEDGKYIDKEGGRDYTRKEDSNIIERKAIISEIINEAKTHDINEEHLSKILNSSRLNDLIEFGRVVHAEMETLMVCARNNISAKSAVLFCTTFPCHNCAKHIVAAGIDKVIYIEPYPKSKALDFHYDSIISGIQNSKIQEYTYFEPFIGIGPRKFFDLFSMNLGSGRTIKRKDKEGKLLEWDSKTSKPKIQLFPISYIDRENSAHENFQRLSKK